MALDPERKVKVGDRMQIPASTYNSLIDMLREYKRNKGRVGPGKLKSTIDPHNTILVQNLTGQDLDAFKILRMSGILTDLQDDPFAFGNRPAFGGYVPETDSDAICITLHPSIGIDVSGSFDMGSVGSNESGYSFSPDIVPAVVSGVAICLVKLIGLTDEWANATPGTTDYLTSASTGQARILYWEALSGSLLEEGSIPDDVVIAIVNLIGSKEGSSVRYSRDNNTGACGVIFAGNVYEIPNSETGPQTSDVFASRRIIFEQGPNSNSPYGPQLYIPAGSGRVVVDAAIQIIAQPQVSVSSYIGNFHGIFFSFDFDIVSIDESGNLKSIVLYDENGFIEHEQAGIDQSGHIDDKHINGLTDDIPVLSGQSYNGNGVSSIFGDYSNVFTAWVKRQTARIFLNVTDIPVRLALRVAPKVNYTTITQIGSGDDVVMTWGVMTWFESSSQASRTFIDYMKVQKDRDFCDTGIMGSGGSVDQGSINPSGPPDRPGSFHFGSGGVTIG